MSVFFFIVLPNRIKNYKVLNLILYRNFSVFLKKHEEKNRRMSDAFIILT